MRRHANDVHSPTLTVQYVSMCTCLPAYFCSAVNPLCVSCRISPGMWHFWIVVIEVITNNCNSEFEKGRWGRVGWVHRDLCVDWSDFQYRVNFDNDSFNLVYWKFVCIIQKRNLNHEYNLYRSSQLWFRGYNRLHELMQALVTANLGLSIFQTLKLVYILLCGCD